MKSLRETIDMVEAAEKQADVERLETGHPGVYDFLYQGYGSDVMKKADVDFEPMVGDVVVTLPVDEYTRSRSNFLVSLEQRGIEYEIPWKGRYVISAPEFNVTTMSTGNRTTFYFKLK